MKATAHARKRKKVNKKLPAVIADGLDPRQALFLQLYLDPESDTFSNALQSAMSAGFDEAYAGQLTSRLPKWMQESLEKVREEELLATAEKNIQYFMGIEPKVQAMGPFGPIFEKIPVGKKIKGKKQKIIKKPVYVLNGKLLEIKQKTSHFVAERIGRKRYGRNEPGGNKFVFNFANVDAVRQRYK